MYPLSSAIATDEQLLESPLQQEENSEPQQIDLTNQGPQIRNYAPAASPLLAPSDFEINEKDQNATSSDNTIITTSRSSSNTPSTQQQESDDHDYSINEPSSSDDNFEIYEAATKGNLENLKFLLKKTGEINEYFGFGHQYQGYLTHIAIATNQPELLSWLITNGADIWKKNLFKQNALEYAEARRAIEMLKMLLDKALKENPEKNRLNDLLHIAAKADAPDLMSRILELGGDLDNIRPCGMTLALHAIESGGTKALTWIHSKGVDVFQKIIIDLSQREFSIDEIIHGMWCLPRERELKTIIPLRWALQHHNFEAIEWLISREALHQIESKERDQFLYECLYNAFPKYKTLTKLLIEIWNDPAIVPSGFNAMAYAFSELDGIKSRSNFDTSRLDRYTKFINLITPMSNMAEKIDGKIPLLLAIEHNLIEAIIPLTQATLQHPRGTQLLEEAHRSTKDLFIKDILTRALNDPAALDLEKNQQPENNSRVKPDITNFPLMTKIAEKFVILDSIKFWLGSAFKGLTHRQAEAAKHGIYALLLEWRQNMQDSSDLYENFSEKFTTSLVQNLTDSSINEIDNFIERGERWEKENMQPIINRIFNTLCNLMQNDISVAALPDILSGLGFYRPIAHGITEAWGNAWKHHIETMESSSLQLSPQAADRLLNNFRVHLSCELDSMSGGLLHLNDTSIPENSRYLYTDLMARQLALLAPLWRNNN